ncbi:hypothetical protein IJT17_08025 [bacterium]|nr:hypothetical protein [bacterium]
MSHATVYEIIGYIGSLIVILSFIMTSTVKLRVVNSVGSFTCAVYSLLICAYPTALCNFFIVGINIYQLLRVLNNHSNNYYIVPCAVNEGMYRSFVERYSQDIAKFFPGFAANSSDYNYAQFILSRSELVGLQVGFLEDASVRLELDYSIPEYRDCSVGRFAYEHIAKTGLSEAYFVHPDPATVDYLHKMGFVEGNGRLARQFA